MQLRLVYFTTMLSYILKQFLFVPFPISRGSQSFPTGSAEYTKTIKFDQLFCLETIRWQNIIMLVMCNV